MNQISEKLAIEIQMAMKLARWIAVQQDGIEVKKGRRKLLPALLFDLAIEHQVGVTSLVDGRVYGSAFALVRASMESFVRGAWLQICATAEQVDYFYKKDELPDGISFGQMILALEQLPQFSDNWLSTLKKKSWRPMNSFTHGGMLQAWSRFDSAAITPNYEDEAIIQVLRIANRFALLSLRYIAISGGYAQTENFAAELLDGKRELPDEPFSKIESKPTFPTFEASSTE